MPNTDSSIKLSYIEQRALVDPAQDLFVTTYGLCWNDAWFAAVFEQRHGRERTAF